MLADRNGKVADRALQGNELGGEQSRQQHRSVMQFSDKSNRNWPANRSYRKQTIKPCLTGSRIALSHARSLIAKALSNRESLELEIPQRADNKHRRTVLIENFEPNHCFNFRASVQVEKS
jgi:hypothetical protein